MFPQSTNMTIQDESTIDNPVSDTGADLKRIMNQHRCEGDTIDNPLELFNIVYYEIEQIIDACSGGDGVSPF